MRPSGVLRVTETIVWRFGDRLRPARHRALLRHPRAVRRRRRTRSTDHQHRRSPARTPGSPPSAANITDEARTAARSSCGCGSATPTRRSARRHRDVRDHLRPSRARCAPSAATTSSTGTPPASTGRRRSSSVTVQADGARRRAGRSAASPARCGARTTCQTTDFAKGGPASSPRQPARRPGRLHRRQDHARSGHRQRAAPRAGRLEAVPGARGRGDRAGAAVAGLIADRLADRRHALVAQERPRPAVRRPRARHRAAGRAAGARSCPAIPTCRSRSPSPHRGSRSPRPGC